MQIVGPRWYWIAFLILSTFHTGYGQDERIYRPDWSIKYNPLAIIAYTPGIELALERTIRKNATIHLGGSYLNDFGINPNQDFDGYKLIGEYRFYQPFQKFHENTFLALQFNLKKAFARGRTYLDRANGNYQELTDLRVENTSLDFLLAFGRVKPLRPWLSMDISVVGGVKRLSLASDDIPADAFFTVTQDAWFDFTLDEPGHAWYPVLRLQFKVNFEVN